MKTRTVINAVILMITSVTLLSCVDRRYTYYIQNDTPYCLDSATINGMNNFSLAPGERRGPFKREYEEPFFLMSEPLLSLYVSHFSDSDSSYYNQYGTVAGMREIENEGSYIFAISHETQEAYPPLRFHLNVKDANTKVLAAE
jgi:hypothetical protein